MIYLVLELFKKYGNKSWLCDTILLTIFGLLHCTDSLTVNLTNYFHTVCFIATSVIVVT